MLNYRYIFQINIRKQFCQTALGNCYGLKLAKCWLQLKKLIYCVIYYNFRHTFRSICVPFHWWLWCVKPINSYNLVKTVHSRGMWSARAESEARDNLSNSESPNYLSGTSSIGSIDSPLSSSITPHSFIPGLKHSFSANPSHCSLPFLLRDWLHGFSGLFTYTSEHIRFLLFSFFCFPHFICWFCAVA